MRNPFLLALFALTVRLAESQTEGSIPRNHLTFAVLIKIPGDSGEVSYGSGFMLESSKGNQFLVTAKHVLFENNKLRGDNASITILGSDYTDTSCTILEVDLQRLLSQSDLLLHQTADVALVRVGVSKSVVKGVRFVKVAISGKPFVRYDILSGYDDALPGNDVFVYGYPVSIGMREMPQFDMNRPLLRKGIVAGKYQPRKTIIIDCPSYGGNSGGPVVQASPFGIRTKFKVIGIVIEFIPFDESRVNPIPSGILTTNSGYAVVESVDRVLEILKEIE